MVSAVILYTCWSYSNVLTDIDDLPAKMTRLYQCTGDSVADDTVRDATAIIGKEIATDRHRGFHPFLKTTFEAFVIAWKSAGKLTSDLVNKYQPVFDNQFLAAGHKAGNQFLALLLTWFIWLLALGLSLFSNILRDSPSDSSKKLVPAFVPPYSLARTQLVLWITIIGSVYGYAIFWDGRFPDLNQTALILMGISAGTFATAAIIDTTEIQQGIPRIQDQGSSKNFLLDILSDAQGISVHRFQNFVWTLIAVLVYFYRYANPPVDSKEVLPVLDQTLLALTGISSATYLTLKTRENTSSGNPIAQFKFSLDGSASAALSPAEKAAVLAGGFPGATVVMTDPTGGPVAVNPDPAIPNGGFIAGNLVPRQLFRHSQLDRSANTANSAYVDCQMERPNLQCQQPADPAISITLSERTSPDS